MAGNLSSDPRVQQNLTPSPWGWQPRTSQMRMTARSRLAGLQPPCLCPCHRHLWACATCTRSWAATSWWGAAHVLTILKASKPLIACCLLSHSLLAGCSQIRECLHQHSEPALIVLCRVLFKDALDISCYIIMLSSSRVSLSLLCLLLAWSRIVKQHQRLFHKTCMCLPHANGLKTRQSMSSGTEPHCCSNTDKLTSTSLGKEESACDHLAPPAAMLLKLCDFIGTDSQTCPGHGSFRSLCCWSWA